MLTCHMGSLEHPEGGMLDFSSLFCLGKDLFARVGLYRFISSSECSG